LLRETKLIASIFALLALKRGWAVELALQIASCKLNESNATFAVGEKHQLWRNDDILLSVKNTNSGKNSSYIDQNLIVL